MSRSFERGFDEAEQSAAAVVRSSGILATTAKRMQKAAVEGDIAKLRDATAKLAIVLQAVSQDVANAKTAWPFTEEEARAYLADGFESELIEEANRRGLKMSARDARLFAYPSILRVQPADASIRIDRKRTTALRPGFLVEQLLTQQKKKSRYPVERFIETLHTTYRIIVPKADWGTTIKLAQIYQALTLQPGSEKEYGRGDFARDIFMVDQSGVTQTRAGTRLSLPASTGTRAGGSDLFTFVAPTGEVHTYFGIRFTEG
jgi:hypothetical protein